MEKTIPAKAKIFEMGGKTFTISESFDSEMTMILTPAKGNKSLRQLNGLFGPWFKHLSKETGYSIDELHRSMKMRFLGQIYLEDPQNMEQLNWAELMVSCEASKAKDIKKRISLSWITLPQMIDYMEQIANYAISKGYPLPEISELNKVKERAMKTGKTQKV